MTNKNPFYQMLNRIRFIDGDGDGGADDGTDPVNNDGEWQVPEGFDADDFDEEHNPKLDIIKSKRDAIMAERDKHANDVEQMRKKVSASAQPKEIKEYAGAFKPDEKYQPFISDTESESGKFINSTLANMDKIAHENGLTINQANTIKAGMLGLLEDVGVVDVRSAEDKAKVILEKQQEILGENAAEIVKTNVAFVEGYGVFSPAEKELLKLAASEGNPLIVSVIDKIRVLFGKGKSSDIPGSAESDGYMSDPEWLEKYKNATGVEKVRMVEERAKSGRPVKLQLA